MGLRMLAPVASRVDLGPIEAEVQAVAQGLVAAATAAQAADDRAANAQQMVRNRDPRLSSLEDVAARFAEEIARTDRVHAELHAEAQAAMDRAMTPGPAGADGHTGPAGPVGPAGPQGLRGPSGTDGVQGQPGRDGVDGKPGAAGGPGPAGQTGATGAQGPAGPAGTANLAVGATPVGLIALGGNLTVTVPLSRAMPDTSYRVEVAHSAVVNLANARLEVTGKTTTTVTVRVTAVGLALAAGTLIVVAI